MCLWKNAILYLYSLHWNHIKGRVVSFNIKKIKNGINIAQERENNKNNKKWKQQWYEVQRANKKYKFNGTWCCMRVLLFLYKLKNCSQITNDISLHQHQISNVLCANFQKILYLCFRCICVCVCFRGFFLMVLDCDLCDDLFNYENLIPNYTHSLITFVCVYVSKSRSIWLLVNDDH